jgi:four helix bundle protein
MEHANSFKDLVIYQKARTLTKSVFEITKTFPKEEMYSLTDQIRRSSRSIGAQIAEAWGKRRYEKHFISKLTDADAEQLETQHWIIIAQDCEYLTREQFETINQNLSEIGRMLYSMMNKAKQFCSATSDY